MLSDDIELLSPKNDRVFKSLFTQNRPESKIVLMDLISSIINYKVVDVAIRNNDLATTGEEQKQERLDINCIIDNGEQINIEMQSSYMPEPFKKDHHNLKNRSTYYACKLFSTQSLKGQPYTQLAKTYQITFVAYTIWPQEESYINRFTFKNENHTVLTNDLNIIFIELSKLKNIVEKPIEKMTNLEMWSLFLEYADTSSYRPMINQLLKNKEEIGMASTLLESISQDDYERARALSRLKYETDLQSGLATSFNNGVEQGLAQGLAQGLQQGILTVAKSLLGVLDKATIAKKTGLSLKEIEELEKEQDK